MQVGWNDNAKSTITFCVHINFTKQFEKTIIITTKRVKF